MRSTHLLFAGLLALVLCQPSVAQEVSAERAHEIGKAIYASKGLQKLVAAAKALRRMDASQDEPALTARLDCSSHPKPYGTADESFCGIELHTSYGWYADPVLVITVKAFVSKKKLAAGAITPEDFSVRDFSAKIPDPTGLE